MRRMNYNPFKKPFASGELSETGGLHFTLDNPIEEGIYLFEIDETDVNTTDHYTQTGIIKINQYEKYKGESSENYGQAYNYVINYIGNLNKPDENRKKLILTLLNNYNIDTSAYSYIIHLYKIC